METIHIEKSALRDSKGRFLTQSLFLELGYKTDFAVFTLKDDHYKYNGKFYPSLKKLYLEFEDVTEYEFANRYLLGWEHWQKMLENLSIAKHIKKWREELELKIRCQAMRNAISSAKKGNFQAAKYIVNGEYKPSKTGRPTRKEAEREARINENLDEIANQDYLRLVTNG